MNVGTPGVAGNAALAKKVIHTIWPVAGFAISDSYERIKRRLPRNPNRPSLADLLEHTPLGATTFEKTRTTASDVIPVGITELTTGEEEAGSSAPHVLPHSPIEIPGTSAPQVLPQPAKKLLYTTSPQAPLPSHSQPAGPLELPQARSMPGSHYQSGAPRE